MSSLKILTIIGARPQIIKAAAFSRIVRTEFEGRITEHLLHTGQHYDDNMSEVFFRELGIPTPDYNLGVGSGAHGAQTARMMAGIEEILVKGKYDALLVYGDTNSTLAGALAAAKIHIPVIHIEAGLRSFNKAMPEEINRITTDHVSTLLFSPTRTGVDNLVREGFRLGQPGPFTIDSPGVFHTGDVMYDNALYFGQLAEQRSDILNRLALETKRFILATIHRDNNTDQPGRLSAIFSALLTIATTENIPVVLPLHPRTAKLLETKLEPNLYRQISSASNICIIPPAPFLDMLMLEKNALLVATDSGGVQKEAWFFGRPCIILRPETEWIEIVQHGAGILADADTNRILRAWKTLRNHQPVFASLFGDGHSAKDIAGIISKELVSL